ncbi:unnamed protein product [Cyclocybe aegerita]|uniref:Endonuclease/exonuclease/phosphatase domain-containing protein n=1 Tax=Cyclocybe aegerita TaxID=1973307 RepID=A0A8S0XMS2_CYCAE|nr:unnamed protein product [Cyclocybe aegerita]
MFLNRNRVGRALSAFDHASHRWAAIPLRDPHDPITQRPSSSPLADAHAVGKQMLSLTSWNIQASQSKPVARSELILDHILKGPNFPDIILLQEVASRVRQSLLSDPRLCLAQSYVSSTSTSTPATRSSGVRSRCWCWLAGLLREPGCSGGIIAGDFNAIHPHDHTLVDQHGLVDAWVALHGPNGGATWSVGGVELEDDGHKPGRLDKVVMLGLQPDEIEVLQPGLISAYTPWRDHCGLRCTFTV